MFDRLDPVRRNPALYAALAEANRTAAEKAPGSNREGLKWWLLGLGMLMLGGVLKAF
ncbi:hypothetical protein [Muricoccus vinaceus]|uniref:Uncharacterized protein n=1 Tax=Muricoccus vinaceus TaxID=424704 RepID=A0ABV6ILB4_9PROT